jgi:glutathione synthase/RimK-type ligase-like ATP-grasp enzyme
MNRNIQNKSDSSRKKISIYPKRSLESIITNIATKMGLTIDFMCDNWVISLRKNKTTKYIFGYNFGLNSSTSKMICDDKYACSEILSKNNVSCIPYVFFNTRYSNRDSLIIDLFNFLDKYSSGVVCKNNTGTGGEYAYLCKTKKSLLLALDKFANRNLNFITNPFLNIENEFRVIILDGKVLLTYKKILNTIIGDGKSTVAELIKMIYPLTNEQIISCLIPNVLINDILCKGDKIVFSWKNNLQYGADVSFEIDDKRIIEHMALNAVRKVGVRLAAVDIINIKYTGKYSVTDYRVLEINSGIMMEKLYKLGYKKIAKSIYRKIISEMFV